VVPIYRGTLSLSLGWRNMFKINGMSKYDRV